MKIANSGLVSKVVVCIREFFYGCTKRFSVGAIIRRC